MSKRMTIRDVKLVALECRDNRCSWRRERRHDEREPEWGVRRWDECQRGCGNWRSIIECSDGRLDQTTRAYSYSDEYLLALNFTREDCRKELNRRAAARPATETVVIRGERGLRSVRAVA